MKWSRAICIEYSMAGKSRLEEIIQQNQGMTPEEQGRYQMLLESLKEQPIQEGV